ncbi:alpha/beta hydrolase [Paracoccus sp. (in: a-proteobacteria)]|uniref:alpha/beta hydrolase n=1 Tax=Paracoccus sp. TaxID=267 RepID=UPI00272B83B1|nr:alpha/beta-hydrolase family protein [Paracoccus sp. (in: a-proteobacteria)]
MTAAMLTLLDWLDRRTSGVGLVTGALFVAGSLTPSLIPRSPQIQGILAGFCFAAGYGVAVLAGALWRYLQLPRMTDRQARLLVPAMGAVALVIVTVFLLRSAEWQNDIRAAMTLPPAEGVAPFVVAGLGTAVASVLLILGKLLVALGRYVSARIAQVLPRRQARVLGVLLTILVTYQVFSGVLVRNVVSSIDQSAQALDDLIPAEQIAPDRPWQTGSAESLVAWQDLGREGRNFVATTPDPQAIARVTGKPARQPLRVYVGLNAADTLTARADLAVRELERAGGFDRSTLVVAMPTGTGWMDPAAIEPLEHLNHGDVATVALQYSYLQSWISLLVQPEQAAEAGRALFGAVHRRWQQLPEETRPRLYLYGLSLGAHSSQQSLRLHEMLDQPIDGALWVGPPFVSQLWQTLTAERDPGSPAWLPHLTTGEVVRFTDGRQSVHDGGPWGEVRIVFLQYGSDPIVFFRSDSAIRPPEWLASPRAPEVSPDLRWYPIITQLQLAFDMAIALDVPIGHGHVYAHVDHIDPWLAITDPPGWTPERLQALRDHFLARQQAVTTQPGSSG